MPHFSVDPDCCRWRTSSKERPDRAGKFKSITSGDDFLTRDMYIAVFMRVYKGMTADFGTAEARRALEEEWKQAHRVLHVHVHTPVHVHVL